MTIVIFHSREVKSLDVELGNSSFNHLNSLELLDDVFIRFVKVIHFHKCRKHLAEGSFSDNVFFAAFRDNFFSENIERLLSHRLVVTYVQHVDSKLVIPVPCQGLDLKRLI